jgi:hypothetical protein
MLRAATTRMLALELAVCLLLRFGFLQGCKLRLSEHQTIIGAIRLQRLQAFLHARRRLRVWAVTGSATCYCRILSTSVATKMRNMFDLVDGGECISLSKPS